MKKIIFYFKRGYCDTVCYCHMSWSSWRALLFSLLFFLSSHTDSWKALPFILYFPFFSMMFLQNGMFMGHMQKLPSQRWCEEPCWGSPRGTVIHTTQEIPSDHSARTHNTTRLSSSVCVCLWERKPGVRSYFLQLIKVQIQSPHPSFMFLFCFNKPQCAILMFLTFRANVCVAVL